MYCVDTHPSTDRGQSEHTQSAVLPARMYNMLRTPFFNKKEISKEIKTEVVKKVINETLTYGSKTCILTNKHKSRINAAEMSFLREIEGKSKMERIRNEVLRETLQMKPILNTIQQRQLWLGHVQRIN